MDKFYEDMLEEWSIDTSSISKEKQQELAVQCAILYYLQSIDGKLESMKQQEKDYWETWKKAKEKEL